jgi:hypothetical protein
MIGCGAGGVWCAQQLAGSWNQFAGWLIFQSLVSTAVKSSEAIALLLFLAPVLCILLIQSLLAFRRAQPRQSVLFIYSAIIALMAFLTAFSSTLLSAHGTA